MEPKNFIGKIISNFEIEKIIGEGAFSTVCLAKYIPPISDDIKNNNMKNNNEKSIIEKQNNQKRYVACKIIPRKKVEKKKRTTRLDQELRIHQLMHHQNVVQLIDVQKDSDYYYIFLEYCSKGELFKMVINRLRIPENEAAVYFKQTLIGLNYIHSLNVAHRDLKPENILIDENDQIKIADFGLSKLLDNKSQGFTNTPCGSPCYTSPEILSGKPYDGKKSDIWSCGVILYAMTTGYLPWTKRNQSQLFEQIEKGDFKIPLFLSENCADLIKRMMTVDCNKRITIKEALNHPFLKDVDIPESKFDQKYVSLRKVDSILKDESFEYKNITDQISLENNSNYKHDTNIAQIKKDIQSEDERKKIRHQMEKLSLVPHPRNFKIYHNAYRKECHISHEIDLKNKDSFDSDSKNNNKRTKKRNSRNDIKSITINLKIPCPISPRYNNNGKFKFFNELGVASLSPRRSAQNDFI